ncbi:hypothetical protein IWQ60_002643 [Tieghemiomyces parasiticus]|uniref:Histone-lysine N-methyltransferase n=1 Tax=Tieghemiomyces parasiticus TaxID=78921 RepID=A0A9W8AJ65_9FUNG|nr:hypothetical protein IWQ60_002643 [Tieghemiomyces parasiticus]
MDVLIEGQALSGTSKKQDGTPPTDDRPPKFTLTHPRPVTTSSADPTYRSPPPPATPQTPAKRAGSSGKATKSAGGGDSGGPTKYHQGVGGNHTNRVCLLNLVHFGLLRPASVVNFRSHTALVTPEGTLRPNPNEPLSLQMQAEYETPSAWATAVCKMGRHGRVAVNGWSSVKVWVPCETFDGQMQRLEVPLDALRQKYLAATSGDAALANLPLRHFLGDSRKRKLRKGEPGGDRPRQRNRKTFDGTVSGSSPHEKLPDKPATPASLTPPPKRKYVRQPKPFELLADPTDTLPDPSTEETGVPPPEGSEAARRAHQHRLRTKRQRKLTQRIRHWLEQRRITRGVPWAFPVARRQTIARFRAGLTDPSSAPSPLPPAAHFRCVALTVPPSTRSTDPRPCGACGHSLTTTTTTGTGLTAARARPDRNVINCRYCEEDYHLACAGYDPARVGDVAAAGSLVPPALSAPPATAARRTHEAGMRPCAHCATCERCDQREPAGQLLQCDQCPRLCHVPCLDPSTREAVRQCRRWVCGDCVRCQACGSQSASGDLGDTADLEAAWTYDYTLCGPCGRLLDTGNLCPLCQNLYRDDDYETPMIACDGCGYWVHAGCDAHLTPARYQSLVEDEASQYFCPVCRSEQEESLFWTLPVAFERERVWVASLGGIRASLRTETRERSGGRGRPSGSGKQAVADRLAKWQSTAEASAGPDPLIRPTDPEDLELDVHPILDLGYQPDPPADIRRSHTVHGDSAAHTGLGDLLLAAADTNAVTRRASAALPLATPRSASLHPPTTASGRQFMEPPLSARASVPAASSAATGSSAPSVVDAAEMLLTLFSAEPSPAPTMTTTVSTTLVVTVNTSSSFPRAPIQTPGSPPVLASRPHQSPSLPVINPPQPMPPALHVPSAATRRPSIAALLASPPLNSTNSTAATGVATTLGSSGGTASPVKCLLCHGKELSALASQHTITSGSAGGNSALLPSSGTGRLLFLYSQTYPNSYAHIDCLLWLSDIHINDRYEVDGIEAALVRAQQSYCNLCARLGATVKCAVGPYCPTSYHISCLFSKPYRMCAPERRPALYHHLRCLLCHVHAPANHVMFSSEDAARPTAGSLDHRALVVAPHDRAPGVVEPGAGTDSRSLNGFHLDPQRHVTTRSPLTAGVSSSALSPIRESSGRPATALPMLTRATAPQPTIVAYRIGALVVRQLGTLTTSASPPTTAAVVSFDFPDFLVPLGFTCERSFGSYINPTKRTRIRCEVVSLPADQITLNFASDVNPEAASCLAGLPFTSLTFGAIWQFHVEDDSSANGTITARTLQGALRTLLSRYAHGPSARALASQGDRYIYLREPLRFVGLANRELTDALARTVSGYRALRERFAPETRATDILVQMIEAQPRTQLPANPPCHPRPRPDGTFSAARTDLIYRRRTVPLARATTTVNAFDPNAMVLTSNPIAKKKIKLEPGTSGTMQLCHNAELTALAQFRADHRPRYFLAPSECYQRLLEALDYRRSDDPDATRALLARRAFARTLHDFDRIVPPTHRLPPALFQTHYPINRAHIPLAHSGSGTGMGSALNGGSGNIDSPSGVANTSSGPGVSGTSGGVPGTVAHSRQRSTNNLPAVPRSLFPSSESSSPELSPIRRSSSPGIQRHGQSAGPYRGDTIADDSDLDDLECGEVEFEGPGLDWATLSVFGTFGYRPNHHGILPLSNHDPVGVGPVIQRMAHPTSAVGAFFRVVGVVGSTADLAATLIPSSQGHAHNHVASGAAAADDQFVAQALRQPGAADLTETNRKFWEADVLGASSFPAAPPTIANLGLFSAQGFAQHDIVMEFVGETVGAYEAARRQGWMLSVARSTIGSVPTDGWGHAGLVGVGAASHGAFGGGGGSGPSRSRNSQQATSNAHQSSSLAAGSFPAQRYPHCIMIRAGRDTFVDASRSCAPNMFIQHSAKPNLYPRTIRADGDETDSQVHVVLCAARAIEADEELTLCYD